MPEAPLPPSEGALRRTAPAARKARRMPAIFRYFIVALLGAALAAGASYLLRKIGL